METNPIKPNQIPVSQDFTEQDTILGTRNSSNNKQWRNFPRNLLIPSIGANGNWFIGGVDTGIKSRGDDAVLLNGSISFGQDINNAAVPVTIQPAGGEAKTYNLAQTDNQGNLLANATLADNPASSTLVGFAKSSIVSKLQGIRDNLKQLFSQDSYLDYCVIDTTALDEDTYYPLVFESTNHMTDGEIKIEVNMDWFTPYHKPSWATNNWGFTLFFHEKYLLNGNGVFYNNTINRTIYRSEYRWTLNNIPPIGNLFQDYSGSAEIIYVRGGSYYHVRSKKVIPTLYPTGYTWKYNPNTSNPMSLDDMISGNYFNSIKQFPVAHCYLISISTSSIESQFRVFTTASTTPSTTGTSEEKFAALANWLYGNGFTSYSTGVLALFCADNTNPNIPVHIYGKSNGTVAYRQGNRAQPQETVINIGGGFGFTITTIY
ncbi:hypothetical protein AGMMS4956_18370 [Bacteroidia bacterium]|nr:hypothetical protein AGMMS4956_18370 [Bacteroidia bacterium]